MNASCALWTTHARAQVGVGIRACCVRICTCTFMVAFERGATRCPTEVKAEGHLGFKALCVALVCICVTHHRKCAEG